MPEVLCAVCLAMTRNLILSDLPVFTLEYYHTADVLCTLYRNVRIWFTTRMSSNFRTSNHRSYFNDDKGSQGRTWHLPRNCGSNPRGVRTYAPNDCPTINLSTQIARDPTEGPVPPRKVSNSIVESKNGGSYGVGLRHFQNLVRIDRFQTPRIANETEIIQDMYQLQKMRLQFSNRLWEQVQN